MALEGADVTLPDLFRLHVEMVVSERLQSGEHGLDLTFFATSAACLSLSAFSACSGW